MGPALQKSSPLTQRTRAEIFKQQSVVPGFSGPGPGRPGR